MVAADTPHSPSSWVQRLRHGLRDRILGDLVARGAVRDVEETELGFIVVHRHCGGLRRGRHPPPARRRAGRRAGVRRADRRAGHPGRRAADGAGAGLTGDAGADARRRLEEIAGGAGFSGNVSLDDSVVRPSVGLVVAALARAVDRALGKRLRHPPALAR